MADSQSSRSRSRQSADPQKDGKDLHRLRGKVASLKKLLKDIRPGLAVYAKQTNDEWWRKKVAEVDRALGNPPEFPPSTRSA